MNFCFRAKRKRLEKFRNEKEILFGMFPVLMALKAEHRACHRLFIVKHYFDDTAKGVLSKNDKVLEEILHLAEKLNIEIIPSHPKYLSDITEDRPHQVSLITTSCELHNQYNHFRLVI